MTAPTEPTGPPQSTMFVGCVGPADRKQRCGKCGSPPGEPCALFPCAETTGAQADACDHGFHKHISAQLGGSVRCGTCKQIVTAEAVLSAECHRVERERRLTKDYADTMRSKFDDATETIAELRATLRRFEEGYWCRGDPDEIHYCTKCDNSVKPIVGLIGNRTGTD